MPIPTAHAELIKELRTEAADARHCFRSYCIQGFAFTVAATSIILIAAEWAPFAVYGSIGVFFILLAIQRLGIHKISTANRIYGYELHLERHASLPPDDSDRNSLIMNIGWEEACRAWRIVQATLFNEIYRTPQLLPGILLPLYDLSPVHYRPKPKYSQSMSDNHYWWLQRKRAEHKNAKYHAGSYLARMFAMLNMLAFFALLPLLMPYLEIQIPSDDAQSTHNQNLWAAYPAIAVLFVGLFILFFNSLALRGRRKLLEDEILSIHSCALVWKAVVLAHNEAWYSSTIPRRHYTERLSDIARVFAKNPQKVRKYLRHDALPQKIINRLPPPENYNGRASDPPCA